MGLVMVKFYDDCSHEVLVALVVIVVFYVAVVEHVVVLEHQV